MTFDTEGKVITCKAAVCWRPNEPLAIEDVEVDPPRKDEVRIKVLYNGCCFSDTHAMKGTIPSCKYPVILGHEASGIVESVGEGVTEFAPGDWVIPTFMSNCQKCKTCLRTDSNMCETYRAASKSDLFTDGVMADGTTRFRCKGEPVYTFLGVSSFSQFSVLHSAHVVKTMPGLKMNRVCLLGCGVGTGYGSATTKAKVQPGSTVAVWGLGAVGLAAVMGAKASGATTIVAVDLNSKKFEAALKLGATHVVNPKTDCPAGEVFSEWLVNKFCDGWGFDYTFECCGHGVTLKDSFDSLHPHWGVSVMVGVAPHDLKIPFEPIKLIKGRTWTGALYGGMKGKQTVPGLVQAYQDGKLRLDDLVTHEFKLGEVNEAFDILYSGECLRAVIDIQNI